MTAGRAADVREAVTATVTCVPRARGVEHVRVALRGPALPGGVLVDEHLRVALPASGAWAGAGDVLHEESAAGATAAARAVRLAARHPGALVVAVHHGCWCRLVVGRRGSSVALRSARWRRPSVPWPVWASLAHAVTVAALPAEALAGVRVRHPASRRAAVGCRGQGLEAGAGRPRVR
ncbi:hypothetical protein GPA10_16680 [Streptomyces sp. p1417]|uniref:Uncharacterized protein n=1 Tax=Streptomyces typhae TaxID=2681492 RepID=A0A6L6WXW5_9ACTN|nr:hypothetical protein [Streptomyces typhae]MVO86349.1 hypothetical protein [Streptomyces typhae]